MAQTLIPLLLGSQVDLSALQSNPAEKKKQFHIIIQMSMMRLEDLYLKGLYQP